LIDQTAHCMVTADMPMVSSIMLGCVSSMVLTDSHASPAADRVAR